MSANFPFAEVKELLWESMIYVVSESKCSSQEGKDDLNHALNLCERCSCIEELLLLAHPITTGLSTSQQRLVSLFASAIRVMQGDLSVDDPSAKSMAAVAMGIYEIRNQRRLEDRPLEECEYVLEDKADPDTNATEHPDFLSAFKAAFDLLYTMQSGGCWIRPMRMKPMYVLMSLKKTSDGQISSQKMLNDGSCIGPMRWHNSKGEESSLA